MTAPALPEPCNCHQSGGARGAYACLPLAARRSARRSAAAPALATRTAWVSAPRSSPRGKRRPARGDCGRTYSTRILGTAGLGAGAARGKGPGAWGLLPGTWGTSRGDRPWRRRAAPAEAEHLALAGSGGGALRPPAAPRCCTLLPPGSSAALGKSCALVSPPVKRPGGEGESRRLPSALRFCDCVSEVQEGKNRLLEWEEPSPTVRRSEGLAGHLLFSVQIASL